MLPTGPSLALSPWIRAKGLMAAFPCMNDDTLLLTRDTSQVLDQTLKPIPLALDDDTRRVITQAQRLPDGGIALAHARARLGEPNVLTFEPSGVSRFSFPVGDGVHQFAVDRQGRFWVGYFDEGIYGEDPLSGQGLGAFSPDGTPWFGLRDDAPDAPHIDDCYALTLDSADRAWFCAYHTFELGYVAERNYRRITTDPIAPGAKGLIVSDRHVAYIGSYDTPDAAIVFDPQTWETRVIPITTDRGRPLNLSSVMCRGDLALCVDAEGVFRFTLTDLLRL